MVTDRKKDIRKTPVKQGPQDGAPEPNKINASTHYDFNGKNLTPYGGLLPVITVPAVWQRNPQPTAILPAVSRPSSAPPGQLMTSSGPNRPGEWAP